MENDGERKKHAYKFIKIIIKLIVSRANSLITPGIRPRKSPVLQNSINVTDVACSIIHTFTALYRATLRRQTQPAHFCLGLKTHTSIVFSATPLQVE
jgi:tRNA A37 threonylcarbamoyladenosine dehydratase